ncbi:MAG: autotransporter-associated beta strand repeat-containing protein [Kiritimatiellia bacterium]
MSTKVLSGSGVFTTVVLFAGCVVSSLGTAVEWLPDGVTQITGDGTAQVIEVPAEGVTTKGISVDAGDGLITVQGGPITLTSDSDTVKIQGDGIRFENQLVSEKGVAFSMASPHEGFLPAYTAACVFANRKITDLVSMSGSMSGAWLSGKTVDAICIIYDRTETGFTCQFQCKDGSYTKATRYYFSQNGNDIYAYGEHSGYSSSIALGEPLSNFNLEVSTATTNGAYGAYQIQAVFADSEVALAAEPQIAGDISFSGGSLKISPMADMTITNRISGDGRLCVSGNGRVRKYGLFLGTEPTVLLKNAAVENVTIEDVRMGGGAVSTSLEPFATKLYHEVYDATNQKRTVQAQLLNDGYIKAICVQLEQIGEDVGARILWSKYAKAGDPSPAIGIDFSTMGSAAKIATSFTGPGYGCAEITLLEKGAHTVLLSGVKDWTGGTFVENGVLCITANPVPANSETVVGDGGRLLLEVAAGSYMGGGTRTYTIEPGGSLQGKVWLSLVSGDVVNCQGGTIESLNSSILYLNDFTLSNGGVLCGLKPRAGYAKDADWTISGDTPVTLTSGIWLFNNGQKYLNFTIQTDTSLLGALLDDSYYSGAGLVKQGPASLTLNADNSFKGPIVVREGNLILARTGSIPKNNAFTLEGGVLKPMASTINAGMLTVSGKATIDAAGGVIAFADSSAQSWADDGYLMVENLSAGRARNLRFGTDVLGLTEEQLMKISFDGGATFNTAYLDSEGYLRRRVVTFISIY